MHSSFHRKITFVFVQICLLFVFSGIGFAQQSAFGTVIHEQSSRDKMSKPVVNIDRNEKEGSEAEEEDFSDEKEETESTHVLKLKNAYKTEYEASVSSEFKKRFDALLKEARASLEERIDYCTKNINLDEAESLALLNESLSVSTFEKSLESFPANQRSFIKFFQNKFSALKMQQLRTLEALNKKYIQAATIQKETFARAGDLKTALQFQKFAKELKATQGRVLEPQSADSKKSQKTSQTSSSQTDQYQPGLLCKIFYGDETIPLWKPGKSYFELDLNKLKPEKTAIVTSFEFPRLKQKSYFGLHFSGDFFVAESGEYTYTLDCAGDSNCSVFVDNKSIAWGNNTSRGAWVKTLTLSEGWHPIDIFFIARTRSAVHLDWAIFKDGAKVAFPKKSLRHDSDREFTPPRNNY